MDLLYKCIPVEHGIEISSTSYAFTYKPATHLVTDLGSNHVRITRRIDSAVEIYDVAIPNLQLLSGEAVATNYATLMTFLSTDIAKLKAGVGTAVANNIIDLLIGGPNTLGGYKVGTGLNVDGEGRLSANATNEITAIVPTEEAMLALTLNATQPYRAIRLDEQRLYYLNANVPPDDAANWIAGPSVAAAVNSFNGRTGEVVPQYNDYNLDMVPLSDKTSASVHTLVLDDGKLYIQNTSGGREEIAFTEDNAQYVNLINALDARVSLQQTSIINLTTAAGSQNTAIAAIQTKNIAQDTRLNAIDAAMLNKAPLVDGKVPYSALPELPTGRKVKVANRAERLALPVYADLTIAYEMDTGNAYALSAGANPAIASNWDALGNAQAMGVVSFNGRTGNIAPQTNDYNTDQISETLTKRFVSPTQTADWDAKETPTGAQTKATAVKTYADETFLTKAIRGANNGVAPLGADGKVPAANLPEKTGGGGEFIIPVSTYIDASAIRLASTWYTNTSEYDRDIRVYANNVSGTNASWVEVLDTAGNVTRFDSERVAGNIVNSQIITLTIPAKYQYRWIPGASTRKLDGWFEWNKTAGSTFVPLSEKNKANGVAPLDADGKVPMINLPAGLPQATRIWRNVKSTKTIGQWTTNTTGNEMLVFLRTEESSNAARWLQCVIRKDAADTEGLTFYSDYTATTVNKRHTLQLVVPAGWQYILVATGGNTIVATQLWYEMS